MVETATEMSKHSKSSSPAAAAHQPGPTALASTLPSDDRNAAAADPTCSN